MKRRTLVYEMYGKGGAGLKVYVLPKTKRPRGSDGIQLVWCNTREAKKDIAHMAFIKDWEALVLIEGLTRAVLKKKLGTATKITRGRK